MAQKWILRTLIDIGFKESDAEIYVYLLKNGPKEAKDVTSTLKLNKQHVYDRLKFLHTTGAVTTTGERPIRFEAVSFAAVLDLLLKAKTLEAQLIEQNKEEILANWQFIIQNEKPQKSCSQSTRNSS
jgi:sugar-specific transcriptional regulator TrmB